MQVDIFSQMLVVFAVIVLEQVIVWFAEVFWEILELYGAAPRKIGRVDEQ